MSNLTFNDAARSERYFTATLLCHLLMTDNFKGCKALFRHIFGGQRCDELKDNFELVSELDPLRDGATVSDVIRMKFLENGRVAVPDLFLRWDNLIMIIEAKFFTSPTVKSLEEQISLQKKAIQLVIDETPYKNCEICFALLTVPTFPANEFKDKDIKLISWEEIMSILEITLKKARTSDICYCFSSINASIKRAVKEVTVTDVTQMSLFKLLAKLPDLIKEGRLYFGFSEGLDRFNSMSLEELENRAHYKLSTVEPKNQPTNNWYPISLLINKVLKFREAS